jgi:hypothetical protein
MFHDYLFPLAVTISLMIFLVQTLWNYDGWDDHVPKGAHSESCQSYALFSFFISQSYVFCSFFLSLQTSYDVFIICALLSFLVHGIYPIILLKKWPVNSLTENR